MSASPAAPPLGVGIVGTGWVAGAHIDVFRKLPGCEVRAVCSRDRTRAAAKIAAHGLAARPFDDLDAMLEAPDVDVVVICTPHPSHPAETIAAARAGKHVVIEKPVALDRESLHAMLAEVERAGVLTSVCFELRWIGLFQNIRAMLQAGLIGRPFYAEFGYFHGCGPWYPQYEWNRRREMAGDAFLTAGCHALDALLWLLDETVVEVCAISGTSRGNPLRYEYDPNQVALLRLRGGAIAKVAASLECRQPYSFPILIQGEHGTIRDDQVSTLDWPGLPRGEWARVPAAMPDSGDVGDHPYLGQLGYFVDCIRRGARPHNDLAACAHAHEVMFAVQQAIATRRTVTL